MNASIHFFYRFGYLFCCLFLFYATSLVGQYRFNALSNEVSIISESSTRNNKTLGVEFQVVDIRAHQLNLLSFVPPIPFSPEGLLIFYYTSTLPFYLTIGAERPLAGFTFVAQNLYAAVALSNLNMIAIRFSLQQLGITPGMQWPPSALLRIYLHFSQQPVPNPGQDFYQYDLEVRPLDDDASNEYADSTSEEPPLDQSDPPPNLNSPITSMTHIGCSIPNVDLANSTHPAGSGYAGDQNACGPAAASNSLMWMSQTFSGISIPFSHRDLLDSLSKYMGRQPNSGVNIETFIQGKLNFIKAHNLPIQIKFQSQDKSGNINASGGTYAKNSNDGKYPTWDFLKQEVADSEDVELFYRWHDGEKWRGHVVTVTGVYETEDGKKTVGIKHDVNQKDTGGTVQEYPEITVDGLGRMVLHRHGAKRYVSHVVSESPGAPFITSVNPEDINHPTGFYLEQNYPNPFNPSTKISWQSSVGSWQTLKIYDVLGNEVVTLVNEYKPAGTYEVEFKSTVGSLQLASGMYFYTLNVRNYTQTKKMIILR
ncbi:MAG: hypothetical protein A2315_02155 [Ignavibacteria bacterium RIFOXYB2_FULL_35_12]|nr:MAG: hypothetical protein A2006_02810 [Ignavibacteria bacterium GWC2_35_8]OGU59961.1 MAG: hypothetical protein A2X60_06250 [Ignavibacteria bacterium GWF2_35_20]OGU80676.1 MAG: hypothetical protein A2254_09460 [Ignavibacteria bacterium RIFOXYA2_FULL_35_9]OGU88111.1 MAG: hypothetical protein A2492_03435 [Ignavibacteria bacterium RIFOXYC12_FULL_35_11]OGU91206.1 MAG: hypothetical protein A3K31_17230 [Ignavibacteria bacterium RIFOXYA12_FULL_35_25]OGU94218.1 MAG: hypothetical protein A2347_12830 